MDYKTLTETRQSCRAYDASRRVSREDLAQIVEAGRLAPSACNSQSYHFYAVTAERAPEIAVTVQDEGMNRFAGNCTAFVVITEHAPAADAPESAKRTFEHYGSVDIGLAASQLVYRAQELGIASCILGWLNEKKLQAILHTEERVRLVIALGYAKEGDPLRIKKRRAPDEMTTWL